MRRQVVVALFVGMTLCGCATQEAHRQADVPDSARFEAILDDGLRTYFTMAEGHPVRVQADLLRREPIWVGDARPRYFAWVTVAEESTGRELRNGAVRLAGADGRLIVTDFASREQLLTDPNAASRAFPTPVAREILDRAHR